VGSPAVDRSISFSEDSIFYVKFIIGRAFSYPEVHKMREKRYIEIESLSGGADADLRMWR
jgi:molecular chaperone DnaK (HSP70)